MMKQGASNAFLAVTAAIELGAGLAFLCFPAWTTELLLGATLETAAATVVARIGGAGLTALGVSCLLARGTEAKGLVVGMLFYNSATATILALAAWQSGLQGWLLWPAVILHGVMTGWCLFKLRSN